MNLQSIKNLLNGQKIIIFHDQISNLPKLDELDVIKTADWLKEVLENFGARVKKYPFLLNLSAMKILLEEENPLLVFNLVDAVDGKCRLGHLAAALLEMMRIPYSGCNNNAMFMISDKVLAKAIMRRNNIPTPDWSENGAKIKSGIYIVKSAYEHASIGLDDSNIVGAGEVQNKINECTTKFSGKWFAEKYIAGREFSAPIMEIAGKMEVLPLAEICYPDYPKDKKPIQDYSSKCDANSFGYNTLYREFVFPEKDFSLLDKISRISEKCCEIFGLSSYARIDFRVDENGNPLVIDINANPSLEPDVGFFLSAERKDIDYAQVIGDIVLAALKDRIKTYAPA